MPEKPCWYAAVLMQARCVRWRRTWDDRYQRKSFERLTNTCTLMNAKPAGARHDAR